MAIMDAGNENPYIVERFLRGVEIADSSDNESAIAFHLATLQEKPRSRFYTGAVLGSLGAVCFKMGNYDDAIRYYYQSIETYPGFPSTYMYLHKALSKRGRHLERIKVFFIALINVRSIYEEQLRQEEADRSNHSSN